MKIIQHRVNEDGYWARPRAKYAEVDIQIDTNGDVVARHNPEDPWRGWGFQYLPRWSGFLVDIKQNLSIEHLQRIVECFDNKLIGFIDVPFPSVYFAATRAAMPIYGRYSRYEPFNALYRRLWLDPIGYPLPLEYYELMDRVPTWIEDVIIAAPSLHGESCQEDIAVCRYAKKFKNISGIVTKYPEELACA